MRRTGRAFIVIDNESSLERAGREFLRKYRGLKLIIFLLH